MYAVSELLVVSVGSTSTRLLPGLRGPYGSEIPALRASGTQNLDDSTSLKMYRSVGRSSIQPK